VAANKRQEAAERREAAAAAAAKKKREERLAALAAARTTYQGCLGEIDALMTDLTNIDARLDVGLTEMQLSDLVGQASIDYSKIDVDALGTGRCLEAAVRLENAFNKYNASVQKWNDCIFDYGCDNDSIQPSLQSQWLKASTAVGRAQDMVDSLNPDDPNYVPEDAASGGSHT